MKKGLKILTIMVTAFMSVAYVKADTIINIQYGGNNYSEYYYLKNLTWNKWFNHLDPNNTRNDCNGEIDCYNKAINYFNSLNYQYYSIYLAIYPRVGYIEMGLVPFNYSNEELITQSVYASDSNINRYKFEIEKQTGNILGALILAGWSDSGISNNFYMLYDTNFNFKNDGNYIFKGFYDDEDDDYNKMLKVDTGQNMPKIKDLIKYNSWSEYEQEHLEGYTEVNLDNYEYVLLTLKNYNQTQAFQTNLQVKGQIGITPIYNYGQTSKDSVTGVQVQDRCNISYENYTSYPFYILQTDLQNNVIYAVKECEQGSSFKFDNTIFDITYITQQNKDNPTVTINGKTYNVIPYDNLPSTATKNEEDNYIPGESGQANSTGGLDSAIKGAQQKMSEIWNTMTYFTSFIGQIFSSLPSEVHTILISAFTIMVILGIIKIFLGH